MANEHVIKYYARLIQKGTYMEEDIPEELRSEVMKLAITLPPRINKNDGTYDIHNNYLRRYHEESSSETIPVMRRNATK